MSVPRYIEEFVKKRLLEKLVLVSGPRQSGKTTLSKQLSSDYEYFNYDTPEDRVAVIKRSWDRKKELVIFDELHKMKEWKTFLKGVYDKEGIVPQLLVTGSARLDTFRKMGDSLAGRYFKFRLHPLDLKEVYNQNAQLNPQEILDKLMRIGGFPEPFFKDSLSEYKIWKKTHHDSILRQDLLDLEEVRHIQAIETLIELLRDRVGSPISYSSLAEDLQFSPKTIKNWLTILENLFIIFKVTPYHKNIARSLLKEPKYYFFDTGLVRGDDGVKLENAVACALLKELHFREDTQGCDIGLHYLRTKEGHEVDFLTAIDNTDFTLLEVKLSDQNVSKPLAYFSKYFHRANLIQLVKSCDREKTFPNKIEVRKAANWLTQMAL